MEVELKSDAPNRQLPSPQPQQYRGASIVLIIIALIRFLTVTTTISSLVWGIERSIPIGVEIWRSIVTHQNQHRVIDYFPLLT